MNKSEVLKLVDSIMHKYASNYRCAAKEMVEEKLTSTNKQSDVILLEKTQEEKFLEKHKLKDVVVCVETSKNGNIVVDPKPIFLTEVLKKYLSEVLKKYL